MKALSLWQPWASLIAVGTKRYETRDWPPPHAMIGQRIAIHSAKKPIEEALRLSGVDCDRGFREACLRAFAPDDLPDLPLGAVVCTAIIRAAYQSEGIKNGEAPIGAMRGETLPPRAVPVDRFGDYSAGRWLWLLSNIRPVAPPIPCRGHQKLFDLPSAIAEQLS